MRIELRGRGAECISRPIAARRLQPAAISSIKSRAQVAQVYKRAARRHAFAGLIDVLRAHRRAQRCGERGIHIETERGISRAHHRVCISLSLSIFFNGMLDGALKRPVDARLGERVLITERCGHRYGSNGPCRGGRGREATYGARRDYYR